MEWVGRRPVLTATGRVRERRGEGGWTGPPQRPGLRRSAVGRMSHPGPTFNRRRLTPSPRTSVTPGGPDPGGEVRGLGRRVVWNTGPPPSLSPRTILKGVRAQVAVEDDPLEGLRGSRTPAVLVTMKDPWRVHGSGKNDPEPPRRWTGFGVSVSRLLGRHRREGEAGRGEVQ